MTVQFRTDRVASRQRENPIPFFHVYGQTGDDDSVDFFRIDTDFTGAAKFGWRMEAHRHRHLHHFAWIESGFGQVGIESTCHGFTDGMFVSVPPNLIHDWSFSPPVRGMLLTVSSAFLATYVRPSLCNQDCNFLDRAAVFRVGINRRAATVFQNAFNYARDTDKSRHARGRAVGLAASVLMIVGQAIRFAGDTLPANSSENAETRLVSRFRALVEERYGKHERLAAFCDVLNVSETHLERVCRHVTGLSPTDIIHQRQIVEARRMLFHSVMSVSEIAYGLGFTDPAYFSRFFSRHVGMSPIAYRRSVLARPLKPKDLEEV